MGMATAASDGGYRPDRRPRGGNRPPRSIAMTHAGPSSGIDRSWHRTGGSAPEPRPGRILRARPRKGQWPDTVRGRMPRPPTRDLHGSHPFLAVPTERGGLDMWSTEVRHPEIADESKPTPAGAAPDEVRDRPCPPRTDGTAHPGH